MIAWLCRFQYLNNPFQRFDNYAQLLYRASIPLVVMSLKFSQLPNLFLTLTPLSAIMVVFTRFFAHDITDIGSEMSVQTEIFANSWSWFKQIWPVLTHFRWFFSEYIALQGLTQVMFTLPLMDSSRDVILSWRLYSAKLPLCDARRFIIEKNSDNMYVFHDISRAKLKKMAASHLFEYLQNAW